MGKIFGRNNKNRKSIFDTSDDKYNGADSYGFIKEEQLPEDRSIRRRKKLTLFLTVVFSAALFGIIASVVFRITSGVLDSMDERKHTVDVRPDSDNKPSPTPGSSEVVIDPKAFADIEKLYAGIRTTARAFNPCIANVSAVTYTEDPVFKQKTAQTRGFYGIVYEENGSEYLVLVRNEELEADYDDLTVSFYNGAGGSARVVKRNDELHLAVLAVSRKSIAEADRNGITIVKRGDSSKLDLGSAVIAVGCVNGTGRSVDFGFINSEPETVFIRDNSIDLMETNMVRHKGAFGILINAEGEAVGILSEDFDDGNCLRAISVNSLGNILNDMLNNDKTPVFGAYFTELTPDVRKSEGIKGGIRITEICEGTPADEAGFRKGDTIIKVQDEVIYFASQFNVILRREAGIGKMRVTYMRGGKEYTVEVPITKE